MVTLLETLRLPLLAEKFWLVPSVRFRATVCSLVELFTMPPTPLVIGLDPVRVKVPVPASNWMPTSVLDMDAGALLVSTPPGALPAFDMNSRVLVL